MCVVLIPGDGEWEVLRVHDPLDEAQPVGQNAVTLTLDQHLHKGGDTDREVSRQRHRETTQRRAIWCLASHERKACVGPSKYLS